MQTVYIGSTLVNDVMLGSQRMDDVFTPPAAINAEFLVVASGNSGGAASGSPTRGGGGGGAGGLLSGSLIILPNQAYKIQVGSNDGLNTAYDSYITGSNFYNVATAGGDGGTGNGTDVSKVGGNGGSGGGGATNNNGVGAGGTGIVGQGNNGAASVTTTGGGGGGANSAASGGTGGGGKASSISGASVTYSKGGDGATPGTGGSNGVNFGDGGDGERGDGVGNAGFGKQGVVILRYRGTQKFTGGTVTTDGDFTIHTFTANNPQDAPLFTQYTITYS